MRYWRITLILLFVVGFVGGDGEALAQSEEQPIYLYTGQDNYTWTDPSAATVYVFREPVPKGEREGRKILEYKKKSGWPSKEKFVGQTLLEASENTPFGSGALRTKATFPKKVRGERQRYLLLIKADGKMYCSRALAGGTDYPRYYTLEDRTAVRVVESNPAWKKHAKSLIAEAEKSQKDTTTSNAKQDTSGTSSSPVAKAGDTSRSDKDGSAEAGRKRQPRQTSDSGLLGWVSLQGIHWTWWGGSGIFGLLMFFAGMTVGGSGSSRRRGSSSRGHSKSKSQAFRESNLPGDEDEPSERPAEVEQLRKELREAEERVEELEGYVENSLEKMFKKVIEPLQKKVKSLEERLDEEESEPAPESTPAPEPSHEPAEKVAAAFEGWCQKGSAVRKLDRFEKYLQEEVRGAEVRAIQYEQDAMGDEFVEDARNGITYWLITLDGQQFVLPRPVNRTRFESLQPAYEGQAKPNGLNGIEPASLAKRAGTLVLDEAGRVW